MLDDMVWTDRYHRQGFSQDLETGCPKLAIVKFWGIQQSSNGSIRNRERNNVDRFNNLRQNISKNETHSCFSV